MHEKSQDVKYVCDCDPESCLCCQGCVCKGMLKDTASMDEFSYRELGVE